MILRKHGSVRIFKRRGLPPSGVNPRTQPGDASQGAALMALLHRLLQFLGIERPPAR